MKNEKNHGNSYLVLSGQFSNFEFLLEDDYKVSFKGSSNSDPIGVSCPVSTQYDIELSGAYLEDYFESYHNL